MKSLNAKVTVANVSLYTTEEGRQMIALITAEKFPGRRIDKTTGEYAQVMVNDIKMGLKQFMHIIFFDTVTMLQYFLNKKERGYYTTMPQNEYFEILRGAKLDITVTRYEDGESFINDIDGEEMTSDGVTFHTSVNDIELAELGDIAAYTGVVEAEAGSDDAKERMKMAIKLNAELNKLKSRVFDYPAKKKAADANADDDANDDADATK